MKRDWNGKCFHGLPGELLIKKLRTDSGIVRVHSKSFFCVSDRVGEYREDACWASIHQQNDTVFGHLSFFCSKPSWGLSRIIWISLQFSSSIWQILRNETVLKWRASEYLELPSPPSQRHDVKPKPPRNSFWFEEESSEYGFRVFVLFESSFCYVICFLALT